MICSRNRVPGPGSKIHYPVPNPGNWYPVFALITDEKCNFDLPLHLLITYVMTFDFSLSICFDRYYFGWGSYSHFDNLITDFYIEKIVVLWQTFANWVCTYHYIVIFPYLLESWNRVRVPGYLQPGTRFLKRVMLQITTTYTRHSTVDSFFLLIIWEISRLGYLTRLHNYSISLIRFSKPKCVGLTISR